MDWKKGVNHVQNNSARRNLVDSRHAQEADSHFAIIGPAGPGSSKQFTNNPVFVVDLENPQLIYLKVKSAEKNRGNIWLDQLGLRLRSV
jgi:hypothetical protein